MTTATTTVPKLITVAWLRRQKACGEGCAIFALEWPDGAPLTRGNLRRAVALRLDLRWFADLVLRGELWTAYQRARTEPFAAYQRAMADAIAAYQRAMADAIADALGLPAEEGDDG